MMFECSTVRFALAGQASLFAVAQKGIKNARHHISASEKVHLLTGGHTTEDLSTVTNIGEGVARQMW